ncbi:MAG: hypothetical protein EPN57_20675 [Paraburkholderia sp.]|nr:MAG: hypothetical protein EPN57_20675 [Paraburkholderia sp.]
MDRLIAPNSVDVAHADTAPATGTPGYATDGNPATGVPATLWPAYAFNTIQDEIYNVILAAGLTPDRTKWNQLLTAIQTMLQGGTTNVGVDTGAANAYVVAFTPALSAPVPWAPFWVKIKTANTGASTLNATGTAEPLVGGAHLALQGGEVVANGNALIYWNPTLASGAGSYVLLFCSGAPKQVAPATASQHSMQLGQATGRLLNVQHFVAPGSTTYTPAVGTTRIIVEVVGGGGLGASTVSTSGTQIAVGGGGGAGGYAKSYLTSGFSGVTITIGAGGTTGSPNGGTSSFGSLLSATGGAGGTSANTAQVPPFASIGTLGGVGSNGNIINAMGGQGTAGIGTNTSSFVSGAGGASAFGMGGYSLATQSTTGTASASAGGGGGGALAGGSTPAQNGGAGGPGAIIVHEYA